MWERSKSENALSTQSQNAARAFTSSLIPTPFALYNTGMHDRLHPDLSQAIEAMTEAQKLERIEQLARSMRGSHVDSGPAVDRSTEKIAKTIADLDALRIGNHLDGLTIRELIEESRQPFLSMDVFQSCESERHDSNQAPRVGKHSDR